MYQFHNDRLPATPASKMVLHMQRPQQDWSGEISGIPGKNVIAYNDPSVTGVARAETQNMEMHNNLPVDVVAAPTNLSEVYQGSMKAILKKNTGNCILATFLVGTENLVTWDGVLYDVGNDYMTIYQDDVDRYVIGDIYSLKFVEFFNQRDGRCANTNKGYPSVW